MRGMIDACDVSLEREAEEPPEAVPPGAWTRGILIPAESALSRAGPSLPQAKTR